MTKRKTLLRPATLLTGALATLVLTGCSAFNVGESEFACSGMPNVTTCTSAREVYEMTDEGAVPTPMDSDKQPGVAQSSKKTAGNANSRALSASERTRNRYVTPAVPNRPVPIRTPAQVMRIFIAPWEDKSGDLIVPGYVYTEIQPRRWIIGDQAPTSSPVLRPLQVTSSASQSASGGRSQGIGSTNHRNGSLAKDERAWLNADKK